MDTATYTLIGQAYEEIEKKGDSEMDGDTIAHSEEEKKTDSEETVEDVFNTLTEKQKTAVCYVIGKALEESKNLSANTVFIDTKANNLDRIYQCYCLCILMTVYYFYLDRQIHSDCPIGQP